MNYEVVPLGGDPRLDLNGVRFHGKNFMYWRKKDSGSIRQVVTVFEEKDANIPVRDGMVVLSLKGLKNYSDLKEAILIFQKQFEGQHFAFHFVVNNEQEQQIAEALGRELGLMYTFEQVQSNVSQQVQKMEEKIHEQKELSASGSQMIEKYDNGKLKQYTVNNGVAYENNALLNSEEEKINLLREWMQDPVKAAELSNLTDKARDEMLTKAVMANKKEHYLESTSLQKTHDKVGEVAKETASREDGMVNSELGIVQNIFSNSNQYSAVERDGENVRVVNPNVVNSKVSTVGSSNSSFGNRYQMDGHQDVNALEQEEHQRNIEQVFYIDEEYNLYDNTGKVIGKIGVDGYMPDYSNNTILKNGQVIGYIGDYKDLGKGEQDLYSKLDTYSKPKVKVYKKEEYHSPENKSAAFVRLPVIIFILSALLLIASIVLLFVVE